MKILKFLSENILFVITLFLLAFIPLYPKLPLLDVQHTWVYVRIEDFLVAASGITWLIQYIRKKAVLKTPLTIPIFVFWLVGGLATLFAVIFYFPHLAEVHPSIALLHYLRRIEYIMLFFIAVSSIRNKEFVKYVIATLVITLFLVCVYGFGQKFLGFPAFLTMNEEFAKGAPLTLSQAGRVASTFAGHYDLAAYLVLMAAVMGSLALGVKKIYAKIGYAFLVFLSLSLLLLTTSRVSFFVWFMSMIFLFIIRKTKIQKKYFLAIPLVLILLLTTTYFQGIIQRFGDTVSKAQIVIDASNGSELGIASEVTGDNGQKKILIQEKQSTGEQLPQGSKFISLPTSKIEKVTGTVTIDKERVIDGKSQLITTTKTGSFLIKNVFAYDVSFTTRLQGTWPRAIKAFNRNPISGSGYSSIDVGTDGNYLRILGEVGILGLISFIMIFVIFGIYVHRVLPNVNSPLVRSFVLGVVAGVFGIGLNAILIDVFEASKIAFSMWLLIGITVGILTLYQKGKVDILKDLKKVLVSSPAILLYFFLGAFLLYWKSLSNYFVGDDFTWLRWSADCAKELSVNKIMECESLGKTILKYFTQANGFFYRPGTKLYFFGAYTLFGLNQMAYHLMSIFVHFLNTSMVFFITLRVIKSKIYAVIAAILFLAASTHSESVLWISSINHLLAATFILLTLLAYIYWRESKNILVFFIALFSVFLSPLFHESGIVAPFLILAYELFIKEKKISLRFFKKWYLYLFILQIPIYIFLRSSANSHWMQGDYSYNLLALPFNFVGNIIGYFFLILFGESIIPIHQQIRGSLKSQELIVAFIIVVLLGVLFFSLKKIWPFVKNNLNLYLFGMSLFIFPLLPFLGLGNISLRYSYLATFGFFFILIVIIRQLLTSLSSDKEKTAKLVFLSFLGIYLLFHLFQLQKANNQWQTAGSVTKNVQKKMTATLFDENTIVYFVNTPVKNGQAWIFPVGLEDALWFSVPEKNISVRSVGSEDEAFSLTSQSPNSRVFMFEPSGLLKEVKVK